MGIENIPAMTAEAKQAARVLFATTESLDKYLSASKAAGIDLSRLKYLKRDVDSAGKVAKVAKEAADNGTKIAKEGSKIAKEGQKLWKIFTKTDVFSKQQSSVTNWGGILAALAVAGILTLIIKIQEFVQEANERGFDLLGNDLSKALGQAILATSSVRKLNAEFQEYKKKDTLTNSELDKRTAQILKDNLNIKKQNNDIAYEVRKGREILEQKIKNTENSINTRINKISDTYQKVRADVDKLISNTTTGINKQIEATIAKIQQAQQTNEAKIREANQGITAQSKIIDSLQATLKATKPPTPTDINKITNDVTDKVKSFFNPQLAKVATIESTANKAVLDATEAKNVSNAVKADLGNLKITVDSRFDALVAQDKTLAGGIINLNQSIALQNKNIEAIDKKSVVADFSGLQKQLDAKFNQFVADNNKALNIRDLQQSKLSQDFDKRLNDFINSSNLTNDQRFAQAQAQNKADLNIRDGLTQSKLSQELDRKLGAAIENFGKTSDQRYQDFISENKQALNIRDGVDQDLSRKISSLERDNREIAADIGTLDTKIKEQEKVNAEGNKTLNQMLPLLAALPLAVAGIPALVAKQVPNAAQITQATGTAICNSANGGCLSNALNNTSNNINQNTNNNQSNLLDKLGLAGQAVDLTQLAIINNKLGDQVTGGISGFMNRIVKNQWVDRAVNLITMTAAVHNVFMLSDQAATTFFSILDNILAVPALIVDPNAETIDTKQAFNGFVDGFFKNLFGVAEWTEMKKKWAAANRISQAVANSVNEVRSIGSNIVDAVEQTARLTGKGFNALQDEGLIGEDNWDYSPENLKLKGGLFAKLGKLSDGINVVSEGLQAIESVTSEVRSAVDSANQIKENAKEVDDGVRELFGLEKAKRDEEVTAIEGGVPNFTAEDFL